MYLIDYPPGIYNGNTKKTTELQITLLNHQTPLQ